MMIMMIKTCKSDLICMTYLQKKNIGKARCNHIRSVFNDNNKYHQ